VEAERFKVKGVFE